MKSRHSSIRSADLCVSSDSSIALAMSQLDKTATKILFVVDEKARLLGTLTDGDIRRGLLRGIGLESPVLEVVFANCLSARKGDKRETFDRLMTLHQLDAVPVLDSEGRVFEVWLRLDKGQGPAEQRISTPVLIMAGGRGQRLLPLTKDTPKPLLALNGVSPLDTLLRRLAHQGFANVTIAIQHLGSLIRAHVGDGENLGLKISYIEEPRPLGTAGALGLLEHENDQPTLVVNADVITDTRLDSFVAHASNPQPSTTVGLARYLIHVPYGVANTEGSALVAVQEKPVIEQMVLAGVTFVAPETRKLVEAGEALTMTDLLSRARDAGQDIYWRDLNAFWADMGSPDTYREITSPQRRTSGH